MGFKPFQVGNYRFVELLDRGGSADVFRVESADDKGFLKSFAVKRVTTHAQFDDRSAERLRREAKIHRLLTHPNIARLYDAFRAKESLFLVVEYVEGMNLRSICQKLEREDRILPLDLTLNLVHKVAAGMAYAHRVKDEESGQPLRIVHRDLSPRNLMISRDGEVKVIDFGIACAANITRSTATGCVRGTLAYMSPEQAGGLVVDQRSDIYSVGLILLELLTGGRVFDCESEIELLQKITEGRLPRASSLNPEVSAELDDVVAKATARVPGDRYPTMDAFKTALEKHLSVDPSLAAQRLSKAIKPFFHERRKNPDPSTDWQEAGLTPQEERAMKEGFRKLEGALGIELESYHRRNKGPEAIKKPKDVEYVPGVGIVDWRQLRVKPWTKTNRMAVVMAVLFSLSVGVLLAKSSKTSVSLAKKANQVKKASVAPSP